MSRKNTRRVSERVLAFDSEAIRLLAESGGDSDGTQERVLIRALRRAWDEALTPRQRDYMNLYYRSRRNIYEIAAGEGVSVSTVSRTLRRAKARLKAVLKYYISQ